MTQNRRIRVRKINIVPKMTIHVTNMFRICADTEGEKNHKKGGLNCVFRNFFFYVLDNCPQVQSLK